jgi:transposase-like protein
MEAPLTESCPVCGGEMEPRGRARRGRAVYTCTECGHEMFIEADREGEAPEDEEPEDEN